jgi:hypothetical protein
VAAATVIGGAVGALAGYLFFTDSGRSLRRRLEPALVNLAREVDGFRQSVFATAAAAGGGWRMLTDFIGEDVSRVMRHFESGQTRPF